MDGLGEFYNSVFQRLAFLSYAYSGVWRIGLLHFFFSESGFGLFGRYGIYLVLNLMF